MSKQSNRRRRAKRPLKGPVPKDRLFTTPIIERSTDADADMEKDSPRTSAKQVAFLAAYAILGSIGQAAKTAGCSRAAHHRWLECDPAYRNKFADAQAEANDRLEAEARRRAVAGVERMKFYKGVAIIDPRTITVECPDGKPYIEYECSDRMLELLLKAHMPDKYMDRQKIETTTKADLPAAVESLLADPARIEAEIQANERHLLDDEPGGQLDPPTEQP